MITQVTTIWSTRSRTLVCTLRVGFSPSRRVSGSERVMLGTSKPAPNAGEGRDDDVAAKTAEEGAGVGERMIGGVDGGVDNSSEDDVGGFEEASKPETRFPDAHSKSSALSPAGQPAFHLNVRPSEAANILDWPLFTRQLHVSIHPTTRRRRRGRRGTGRGSVNGSGPERGTEGN
jgi:hypothetical protein